MKSQKHSLSSNFIHFQPPSIISISFNHRPSITLTVKQKTREFIDNQKVGATTILGTKKKPINRKHINTFLTALARQLFQDEPPPAPGTNGTKWRFYCGIQQKTAGVSQGRVPISTREGSPFVPGTVPVCPRHRPAQNVSVYWFFLARLKSFQDLLQDFFGNR